MAEFSTNSNFLLLYFSLLLIIFFSSINRQNFPSFSPFHYIINSPKDTMIYSGRINNNITSLTTTTTTTNTTTTNKIRKFDKRLERVERRLARARAAIKKAVGSRIYAKNVLPHEKKAYIPKGSVYKNPYAFYQSHNEMEKRFKIWLYKEGEAPLFHMGPMKNIYSIEGQFIDELERGKSPFLASHPNEAVAFFIPVSVVNIRTYVYKRHSCNYSRQPIQNIVQDYITIISKKYPFWNSTNGSDHFLVSCHDWAPDISAEKPKLFKNFIRVLCNANSSEGFKPFRDVSLPEINLSSDNVGRVKLKPLHPINRTMLAFFAGNEKHGDVRKTLFKYWKDKDNDIQVHDYLPKSLSYSNQMNKSKFCLCPSGYEVASPRVVESIHAGCVPVIISDGYVLPFSDVLDWKKFSIHIPLAEIPKMKTILNGISENEYLKMHKKVLQVQRHFVLNRPSKPYDMLHMVMHSVWLRRLNIKLSF